MMDGPVDMMEKFKAFLAGSPHWFDEATVEGWAYQVAVILPNVLRKWHDSTMGQDVWAKDGHYYETARLHLAGLSGFRQQYAEASEVLQGLKLLTEFFADEKRKAERGKTSGRSRGKATRESAGASAQGADGGETPVLVLEEGEIKEMHISKHERNAALRKACIAHWRTQHGGKVSCAACEMTFGERYGAIGDGYIEVHHLKPISQTEDVHTVDPKVDLVPLCANCHAMIHRLMAAEAGLEGLAALTKLRNCLKV